jgi:hypothetical protein
MKATAQNPRRSVDDILRELQIQRPNFDAQGSGYVPCPQCSPKRKPANQKKPVLHVTVNRDGVLGFCNHCGWKLAEFFEPRPGFRQIVATYDYPDEGGALLFQTVRFFPKDFRQRRADCTGGWIWSIQGVRRVLYRLPELIAALKAGRKVIYVVEGERDVQALRALNEIATCNPMGAKKWRDEFAEFLRGFDWAIVIADRDDDGRTHARQVAASVSRVVPHVRVIELPGDGIKDVSDFLAADGTIDEIVAIAKATPDWMPDAAGNTADQGIGQGPEGIRENPEPGGGERAGTWPEPDLGVLRLHRRPPPALPLEIFGDRWAQWIKNAARAAACPVDYVAAPLLASASVLIGHARWAHAGGDWKEPPHLWCVSVGDSGDGKSPGGDAIYRRILPEIERSMTVDFPDQLQEAQAAIEAAKARVESWKTDVRKAVKEGRTPPPPPSPVPEEPIAPRLVLSDVTIERIAILLARAAPKGVLMNRDELAGWLLGMTAYNEGARAFWIEAYGGRPFRVDRVKHPEPIVIPRLAVSWHGGIQPARVAEVMRDADDGLLARFVWFWPDPVPFHIAKAPPDTEWAIAAFDRLRTLELASDDGGPRPLMVPLDAAAVQLLERFGQLLQDRKETAAGLMRSAIGKARGLALRLSLVLAYLHWCAEDGYDAPPEFIGEAALLAAAKFVSEYVMPMAERTYGDAACTNTDRNTATLARWIAKERPSEIHVRDMQRKIRLPGLTTADAIHAACKALIEAGWLGQPTASKGFQQRGKEAYPVSPRLKEVLP